MRRALLLLLFLLPVLSASAAKVDRALLEELDSYVRERERYQHRKEEDISRLRHHLNSSRTEAEAFSASMDIAEAFFSYRFDSTQFYLKKAVELAEPGSERALRAGIRLGYLYVKSGNYMEAYDRLYLRTDTTRMNDALKQEYYWTLYEFSRDLSGNSGMVERLSIPDRAVYRNRLYKLVPPDSEPWLRLQMDQASSQWQYALADSLGHRLLELVPASSHAAAIYYYDLSEIAYQENRTDDQFRYLVKSAECDIVNAVKDYASLTVAAQMIMDSDVDRSFHYLRIAQEDALAYNAKLRPWQISQFFMDIEQRYEERQREMGRWTILAAVIFLLLAVLLAFALWLLVRHTRELSRARALQAEANARLAEMNDEQLSHITRFLGYLSENVAQLRQDENRSRKLLKQGRSEELLKNLSVSTRAEDALENFYRVFDNTFLGIFPDFVSGVNALLRPDAQLHPRRGERLCTELRIFALIRLGVTDSKEIARMLHYSVSTIYNYKVSVKNGALGDRESFEKEVQKIGKAE